MAPSAPSAPSASVTARRHRADVRGWVHLTMDDDASDESRDAYPTAERTHLATARSRVSMDATTARLVASNSLKKGDVLGAARFAAVQAAKSTGTYLPLFTAGTSEIARVTFEVGEDFVDVMVQCPGEGLSGKMPAMTAATVAALTIFDMCKAVDRSMSITAVHCDIKEPGLDP